MLEDQKFTMPTMNINTQIMKAGIQWDPAFTRQPENPTPLTDWQILFDVGNKVGYDLTQAMMLVANTFTEAFKVLRDAVVRGFTPYHRKQMLLHPSRQTRAFLATKQRQHYTPHAQPKRGRHRR